MKKLMMIVAIVVSSSTVFAGSKDLKMFNQLQEAGAQTEQFMSQIHLGLREVECRFVNETKEYSCSMNDIAANEGNGAQLNIVGKHAKRVFNMILKAGGQTDGALGSIYINAEGISCKQSVEGVSDGSEAERTACWIDIAPGC